MADENGAARETELFREAKDRFMRDDPDSPLTHDQRHAFAGLNYFPYDPALCFEAPLDPNVPDDDVVLETSTGDSRRFRRLGRARFSVDGQDAEVTVFGAEDEELFVPLRDATSGNETYGAGRYLEPELTGENAVLLDFNDLYNPYCAYNEDYSCPLPPRENWLQVPIRAGEKTFHE